MNDRRNLGLNPQPFRYPNPYEEFFPKPNITQNEFLKGALPTILTAMVGVHLMVFLYTLFSGQFLMLVDRGIVLFWATATYIVWYFNQKHKEVAQNKIEEAKNNKEKYEVLSDIMGRIDRTVLAKHGIALNFKDKNTEKASD